MAWQTQRRGYGVAHALRQIDHGGGRLDQRRQVHAALLHAQAAVALRGDPAKGSAAEARPVERARTEDGARGHAQTTLSWHAACACARRAKCKLEPIRMAQNIQPIETCMGSDPCQHPTLWLLARVRPRPYYKWYFCGECGGGPVFQAIRYSCAEGPESLKRPPELDSMCAMVRPLGASCTRHDTTRC